MFNDLFNLIDELNISLIIGFGSKITGKKKGISKSHDIDLILVSDYFENKSDIKRKKSVEWKLKKKYDIIFLTNKEYISLKENKNSIVNIAIEEGEILYYR